MGSYELGLGKPYIYIISRFFFTPVKPIYRGIYKGDLFLDTYLVDCPRTKKCFVLQLHPRLGFRGGGESASFPGSPMDPHVVSMWCLTATPECRPARHVGSSHQGGGDFFGGASHGLPGIK